MRTPEEIVARCKVEGDRFSIAGQFVVEALVPFLTFEQARPLLKPDATENGWPTEPLTREAVLSEMRAYMEFAWGKVQDHRGLSASRSVEKIGAWIWLLGDEEILNEFKATDYAQYGAPKLAAACRHYGFPVPEDESLACMIAGRPCLGCESGEQSGCGS